jgi:hypothetical protein
MNSWNHVKDLMPERDGRYLVARRCGDVEMAELFKLSALLEPHEWVADNSSGLRFTDVTHWMPVPKHPEVK